jgi:hypothetical protein
MASVVVGDFSMVLVLLKGIPSGAWVALSSDNSIVLAVGADMRAVLREARKAGEADPIMLRVPETSSENRLS